MADTTLYTHKACLSHDTGTGHPERTLRLEAVLAELEKADYAALRRVEAPQATLDQIARVHDRAYIEKIFAQVPAQGYVQLDPDTFMSPGSGEAALHAAGALIAAVDDVMGGKTRRAFCAVRPPGHHAEHAKMIGFCLFNNIAVGAAHAREAHHVKRIAIVDFDVHHGNGTQEWAEKQDDVLFISSHQFPLWPGSGLPDDHGPNGNIENVPLAPGAGSDIFRKAMETHVLPKVAAFRPELLFISAGFDAHYKDPLAGLDLHEDDFGWVTTELCKLADQFCRGRVISALEGGYNLDALAASAGKHVKALMNG